MNEQAIWEKTCELLREDMAEVSYTTWIDSPLKPVALKNDVLYLEVATQFIKTQVVSRYAVLITNAVAQAAGRSLKVEFLSVQEAQAMQQAESAGKSAPPAPASLNPKYTFGTFVVGNSNRFAHAASLAVAEAPAEAYNPLFIYGGVGLGKTHLMHAIGNRFLKNNPKAKVLCVSAQQYTQEFVDAMRLKNVNSERYTEAMRKFDARYRGIDMLLIDDIQSFRDREGTQTNFFLTFESMVPHGKQIVLTSDTYPKNLSEFQDRLLSRLTQGLIVMIEPPEFEMRVQILLQKAERSGINMPQDVAEIIAKRIKSNVRELEGAVQQILAYTRFHQVPVTLDTAKMALRDIFKATATPVTIDNIQKAVAEYYGIKPSDIVAKSRKANLVRARQVAMYLSKELTNKSLPEIGALFGGRDHTTVIYAHRKVMSERNTDDGLKHDIHLLEQRLKN